LFYNFADVCETLLREARKAARGRTEKPASGQRFRSLFRERVAKDMD